MNFERLKKLYQQKKYPILPVKVGQQLEIHEQVGEEGNSRVSKFKGLVIKVKKPQHPDGTFTIRGTVARMTVEKIFPLSFERFEKVLLLDEYRVRRAKLYYIRDKVGKDAKMKSLLGPNRESVDIWALAIETAEKAAAAAKPVEKKKEVVSEEKIEEVKEEKKVVETEIDSSIPQNDEKGEVKTEEKKEEKTEEKKD